FTESGPFVNGPAGPTSTGNATVGTPLPVTVWVADDAKTVPGAQRPRTPAATLFWTKFRGPGKVTFSADRPQIESAPLNAPVKAFQGKATTQATFDQPGEYVIRVVANDWTRDGGGGFQCCWTNGYMKVSVKGVSSGGVR